MNPIIGFLLKQVVDLILPALGLCGGLDLRGHASWLPHLMQGSTLAQTIAFGAAAG